MECLTTYATRHTRQSKEDCDGQRGQSHKGRLPTASKGCFSWLTPATLSVYERSKWTGEADGRQQWRVDSRLGQSKQYALAQAVSSALEPDVDTLHRGSCPLFATEGQRRDGFAPAVFPMGRWPRCPLGSCCCDGKIHSPRRRNKHSATQFDAVVA